MNIHLAKSKKPLEAIRFYPKPFRKMMEIFARALPNESIVWLTGTVRKNVGIVRKCWKPKLEFASQVDARTDAKWLLNFLENLQRKYPKHNLIIEAHRHPIGSELSSIDENALQGLTDWNPNFYWLMIACDIPLGCYEFDKTKLHKIKWEIIGDGKKADS